jgi:hypothetical protein
MEEWFGHDNGQYINVVMLMATLLVLYHMYFSKQACNVSCMRFNVSATYIANSMALVKEICSKLLVHMCK